MKGQPNDFTGTERQPMATPKSTASPVAEQTKEIARSAPEKVKQISQSARQRALQEIDSKRESLAGEIEKLAGTLEQQRNDGGSSSALMDVAANAARRLSSSLGDRSAEELFRGVTRNPMAVLAGSFALGFIATRLLKE